MRVSKLILNLKSLKKCLKEILLLIIIMEYLWEVYNEIGYKVKNVDHLKHREDKLIKIWNDSRADQNKKTVFIFERSKMYNIVYNCKCLEIPIHDIEIYHKAFFQNFVVEPDFNCNICMEKSQLNNACQCSFRTYINCRMKLDRCPQCRNIYL